MSADPRSTALDDLHDAIAILGVGCRLPGGIETPHQFWDVLRDGREVTEPIPAERWDFNLHGHPDPQQPLHQHVNRGGFVADLDRFDPQLFGISAREASCMDPQQRLLLEVCWRALEDGAQPLDRLRGSAVGVFMGLSSADYVNLLWASEQDYAFPSNEPFVLTGNTGCIAANRISYAFDFKGPSFTVDTACSSSLVAVHLACASLRRGECSLALAGGAQALLHPGVQMSFGKAGLLAADGRCKSFDAAADGYVRSEGAGAVLLKPLSAALRDGDPIQAVIRGSAVNSDGRSHGLAAPNWRAQIQCLQQAYAAAGVDPTTTLYVEAHGTGTRLGDPIELKALGAVVGAGRGRDQPCRVGSVKTNLGHSETAAGVTGLIKAVLCLQQRQLPASLHFRTPNPAVDFQALGLQVHTALEPFPSSSTAVVLGVSSFGLGGTNAHCVISEAPAAAVAAQPATAEPPLHLLMLSAQSPEALQELATATSALLASQPNLSLRDLCATTHLRRAAFPHRLVLVAADREELQAQLDQRLPPVWHGELDEAQRRRPLPAELAELQLGVNGPDGRERLEALGRAVGSGQPFDWAHFHAPYPHRIVALPGHPFRRQRHWWPSNGQLWRHHLGLASEGGNTASTTLTRLNLPGDQQHWQLSLSSQRPVDLSDHRVQGEVVFPAAGYVALGMEIAQQSGLPFALQGLRLESALSLGSTPTTLQLTQNARGLTVYMRGEGNNKPSWQGIAQAQWGNGQLGAPPMAEVDPQAQELDLAAFYAALERVGLGYGPQYRGLQRLQALPGEAWAVVERPAQAPERALLDACFQCVAAALSPELQPAGLAVPVALEAAQFTCWPLPSPVHCHARLRDGGRLCADLVLSHNGQPIGWLQGLRLQPMAAPSPAMAFQTSWQTLATYTATADLPLRPWLEHRGLLLSSLEAVAGEQAPSGSLRVLWPRWSAERDPLEACQRLLSALQGPAQTWIVVLEGPGPLNTALASLLRTAQLELPPAWQLTTLWLPSDPNQQPQAEHWEALQSAAAAHDELRWEQGRLEVPVLEPLPASRFQIRSDGSGRLEGLQPVPLARRPLQVGELELRVEATGLNFRDVLNALRLLDPQAVGIERVEQLPFGGECVGRVSGVGPGVDPALLGERMIAALAVNSLASHVVVDQRRCVPLPNALSIEQGAAVSTAFLTAMHGLETLAQLQAGETVLIHAAAGGVGQAALQIAQRCGARILATASAAKQAALREQPGVELVMDSRSLNFADQVLAHTQGRGVDVVLNSLNGAWVEASFRCLAPGGRFVELGKLGIWTAAEAAERRPDASYLPFDLLEVVEREPATITALLQALVSDLAAGRLQPPPLQAFPIEQCDQAFRWMAQARHVGKVVLRQAPALAIRHDATYLVSGALGGVGQSLVPWLVAQGARSLVLLSRGGPGARSNRDARASALLDSLAKAGVRVELVANPLGEGALEPLRTVLNQLPAELPVRGLFHAAGLLRDRRLQELEPADMAAVMAPKLQGWQELEEACEAVAPGALEFAVGWSSIAALLGSPGQSAYAAANGAMEGWCTTGTQGPKRLAIQWGPWLGGGMAEGLEGRLSAQGIGLLPPAEALEQLGDLIERGCSGVVAVMQNNWPRLIAQAPARKRHWFEQLLPAERSSLPPAREQLHQALAALPAHQRQAQLISRLRQLLERVMAAEQEVPAASLEPIAACTSLFELGVDSLMAAEFSALIQTELGLGLDLRSLSNDPSLEMLSAMALEELFGNEGSGAGAGLDLAVEAQLPNDWPQPMPPAAACPGAGVLLTGASGYLGAYLLAGQLERWPELPIHCLVRAPSPEAGLERVRSNLQHYGLWQPEWAARLEILPGDLSQPRFGLDADRFVALARSLGGILHNGAQLSQMAPYAQLAAANVGGTREVLHLASCGEPLRVELISSVAVFEGEAYRDRVVLESDAVDQWRGIHLGYSQTKWVSEQLVWAAGQAGLPVVVYRPPLIGGHSCTGQWHEGDLLQRLLQGAMALGLAPDLAWALDTVPVDYVADAVRALAWSEEARGRCFHLQHPEPILLADLVGLLQAQGAPLEIVPMAAWLEAIEAQPDNQLHPLLPFLQQRWGAEQLTYPELNSVGQRSRPSAAATQATLAALGVRCPGFAELVQPWAQALVPKGPAAVGRC